MRPDYADDDALRVVVLSVLGAVERRRLPGRRSRPAEAGPGPPLVPTTRATVIRGRAAHDEGDARSWMRHADAAIAEAVATLNRVLFLHRLASADPTVREIRLEQTLVVRVGWGSGEEVAHGRWTEAREHPSGPAERVRERRTAVLRPQERLAALLGGRDAALACEELALRARLDLDAGRLREAALQMRVALEAGLAELEAWRDRAEVAERLLGLREAREGVVAAANAALRGGLDDDHAAAVAMALERLEAALRARTAAGLS